MVYQLHLPNLRYFANSSVITQVHVNSSNYLKSDLVQSISTPNFITSTIMLPMDESQFNLFLLLNNKLILLWNHLAHNYLLSFANWSWVGNLHNIRWGSMGFISISMAINKTLMSSSSQQWSKLPVLYLFTFQQQKHTNKWNAMSLHMKAILFSDTLCYMFSDRKRSFSPIVR